MDEHENDGAGEPTGRRVSRTPEQWRELIRVRSASCLAIAVAGRSISRHWAVSRRADAHPDEGGGRRCGTSSSDTGVLKDGNRIALDTVSNVSNLCQLIEDAIHVFVAEAPSA